VLGGSLRHGPGGKGANQAVAAARAGGEVVFVTAVGDDPLGVSALEHFRREGLDVSHVKTCADTPSGVALIFVGGDGENMIGVAPGANARLEPEDVDRLPADLFGSDRVLLIAGLEVSLDAAARAARRGKAAGMTVVLNPAPAAAVLLEDIDVITPNRVELGQLTGRPTADEAGVLAAARRLHDQGPGTVIVTLGAEGSLIVRGGEAVRVAAHPVRAVDTVGAGDAFNGALAVALAEGRDLPDAAAWAAAAAALAVTRPGAQDALPYRADIDRLAATRC
jgi:ribokinase